MGSSVAKLQLALNVSHEIDKAKLEKTFGPIEGRSGQSEENVTKMLHYWSQGLGYADIARYVIPDHPNGRITVNRILKTFETADSMSKLAAAGGGRGPGAMPPAQSASAGPSTPFLPPTHQSDPTRGLSGAERYDHGELTPSVPLPELIAQRGLTAPHASDPTLRTASQDQLMNELRYRLYPEDAPYREPPGSSASASEGPLSGPGFSGLREVRSESSASSSASGGVESFGTGSGSSGAVRQPRRASTWPHPYPQSAPNASGSMSAGSASHGSGGMAHPQPASASVRRGERRRDGLLHLRPLILCLQTSTAKCELENSKRGSGQSGLALETSIWPGTRSREYSTIITKGWISTSSGPLSRSRLLGTKLAILSGNMIRAGRNAANSPPMRSGVFRFSSGG